MRRRRKMLEDAGSPRIMCVPIAQIYGGGIAGREKRDAALALLAASIAKQGLLQPVIVRRNGNGYALVCGARRLAACKLLGKEEIDALVLSVDASEAALLALEEHGTHQPLSAMQEAQLVADCEDEALYSGCALGRRAIMRRKRMLALPPHVQQFIASRALSLAQAQPLCLIDGEARQIEAAMIIADRALTPAQARRLVLGPRRRAK